MNSPSAQACPHRSTAAPRGPAITTEGGATSSVHSGATSDVHTHLEKALAEQTVAIEIDRAAREEKEKEEQAERQRREAEEASRKQRRERTVRHAAAIGVAGLLGIGAVTVVLVLSWPMTARVLLACALCGAAGLAYGLIRQSLGKVGGAILAVIAVVGGVLAMYSVPQDNKNTKNDSPPVKKYTKS